MHELDQLLLKYRRALFGRTELMPQQIDPLAVHSARVPERSEALGLHPQPIHLLRPVGLVGLLTMLRILSRRTYRSYPGDSGPGIDATRALGH